MRQERKISHYITERKKRKNNRQKKNERERKGNECDMPSGKLFEKENISFKQRKKKDWNDE